MTATLMTWRKSATYTLPSSDNTGCLAGLNAAITAEKAANPSTYQWDNADFSAANGTLTLKHKSGGTRRLMLFGKSGSTPNTNAIDAATTTSTFLFCGVAPTAGVDAPQQAYTAGVPYTTGLWLPGGIVITTYSSIDRCTYFEHADGMVICFHKASMTGVTANIATAFLGGHSVTLDGNTAYDIAFGSAGVWVATAESLLAASAGAGQYISRGGESTAANPRANFADPILGSKARCHTFETLVSTGEAARLRNQPGTYRLFLPIVMPNSDYPYVVIKLRQIAVGVPELFGAISNDSLGAAAYKVGQSSDTVGEGPWLLNFAI